MNINVGGINLFYEKKGAGEPLLLLHGNGEDHHIFDRLVVKLKEDFTVYAIDSRNQGESEKTDDYSYETMARDIYNFIQSLNLEKVNILGFSDGAIVSLMLALKHSQCISKMALLGVNLKPWDFTEESYAYLVETYEQTKDPLFKLMLEEPNIELEELKKVDIPTLVIGGENDIYKQDTFINIAAALPNGTLKIMNSHEHDSYIVGQDLLYEDLMVFFK